MAAGLPDTTEPARHHEAWPGPIENLPAFLAALEGYTRRVAGGGSISTRLFQNETDVRIEGSRASGKRVHGPGGSDDVEFVRRKGQWYVKLITRARR